MGSGDKAKVRQWFATAGQWMGDVINDHETKRDRAAAMEPLGVGKND